MNAEIVHRLEESFQAKPITVRSLLPVVSAAYRSALETQRALRDQLDNGLRQAQSAGLEIGDDTRLPRDLGDLKRLESWFQHQASELQAVMAQLLAAHSSGEPVKLALILQRLADVDVRVDL